MTYEEYLAKNTELAISISKELATYLKYEETLIRFNLLRSRIDDTTYIDIGVMMMDAVRHKTQLILILLEEQELLIKDNETDPQLESALHVVSRYRKILESHEQKYNGFFEGLSMLRASNKGG